MSKLSVRETIIVDDGGSDSAIFVETNNIEESITLDLFEEASIELSVAEARSLIKLLENAVERIPAKPAKAGAR